MSAGIAATLREKLFDHPTPHRREAEFSALATEMFPGRNYFLTFLEERHFDAQVDVARHILLRLAYQARVSPPNKFLYNLLDTESRLAGTAAKATFNGRDHFVHLANLYLLGLYVFWYHPQIHRRVRDQFHDLAGNRDDRSQQEKNISACRGFLVAWRAFVLFHDLGYPWEVSLGMETAPTFLAPFGDLLRYAAKDAALFAISQLLALEWLRREEPPALLENELRTYFGNATSRQVSMFVAPDQVRESWGKSEKLPVTTDSGLWRLICKIVPEIDRFSILETAEEGRPVASTNLELHGLFAAARWVPDEESADPDKLRSWASSNTLPTRLRGRYQWVHYSRNYQRHFMHFVARLFSDPDKAKSFPQFILDFFDVFPPTHSISEELQFDDHAYAIFYGLLESLDFDSFDQKRLKRLVIQDTISQSELGGLQGRLLREVSASLLSLLEERTAAMEKDPDLRITKLPLEEYLSNLLSVLDQSRDLAKQVEERLSSQIKQRVELKGKLYGFYDLLKQQLITKTRESIPDAFETNDTSESNLPTGSIGLNWSAFKFNDLARELDIILANRRLGGIAAFESYRPKWAPRPNTGVTFADHGLASGLLYAQVFQVTKSILGDSTSALGQLLDLRGAGEQELKSVSASHSSVDEVLYSILLHNLYPSSFEAIEYKSFRTKFEKKEAFTFFALLCDSLQPWDRKRLFNQASGSLPYTTYAENFNLEVDGNMLRITERGEQLRIDERQAALRGYLDSYLERASDLVKLHLAEWR
jgi:hypothetical protein